LPEVSQYVSTVSHPHWVAVHRRMFGIWDRQALLLSGRFDMLFLVLQANHFEKNQLDTNFFLS